MNSFMRSRVAWGSVDESDGDDGEDSVDLRRCYYPVDRSWTSDGVTWFGPSHVGNLFHVPGVNLSTRLVCYPEVEWLVTRGLIVVPTAVGVFTPCGCDFDEGVNLKEMLDSYWNVCQHLLCRNMHLRSMYVTEMLPCPGFPWERFNRRLSFEFPDVLRLGDVTAVPLVTSDDFPVGYPDVVSVRLAMSELVTLVRKRGDFICPYSV